MQQKKILKWNIIILLIYNGLSYLSLIGVSPDPQGYAIAFGPMLINMLLVGIHVVILVGLSIFQFVKGNKPLGQAYLANSFFIGLIGFSVCWGGSIVADASI